MGYLSRKTYHLGLWALFFVTLGTALGGIWADQSWGRFWGWDPKENGALLIVENHGKIVELAGDNLAVMGNATVQTAPYELAGIDQSLLKQKTIDVMVSDNEDAPNTAATQNALAQDRIGYQGNELAYNGKRIVALADGFGGRVDFKNGKETLLTVNSDDDHGRMRGRVMDMQNNVMKALGEAFAIANGEERQSKLTALGVPEEEAKTLPNGTYEIKPWQNNAVDRIFPATDEKEEWRKPKPLPNLEIEIPGEKKVGMLGGNDSEKVAVSPSQQSFDEMLSRGMDPQIAYAMAQIKANGGFAHADVDHSPKAPLGGPEIGGGRNLA